MNILITAGGTSEKIDEVRKITNTASGRLGALIAAEFMKRSQAEITYVCGTDAVTPLDTAVQVIRIGSVNELQDVIMTLLTQNKFDAVIHTMAVSDYAVRSVISTDDLVSAVAKTVSENSQAIKDNDRLIDCINTAIAQCVKNTGEHKKISSDVDNLVMFMEKTTKVIKLIKQLQPETILVGFKLLVDVSENSLLQIGHDLLVRNNCDFVLANDLKQIQSDSHSGILIKPDFSFQRLCSKQEIAEVITNNVLTKIRGIE